MPIKVKVGIFDIETSPCIGAFWRLFDQITSDEQILSPTKIISIHVGDLDAPHDTVKHWAWDSKQDERKMLLAFCKWAEGFDVLIGHNSQKFDVKHINARIATLGLPPMNRLIMVEDTLKAVKKKFNLPSNKLRYLCKHFGVALKKDNRGWPLWIDVCYLNDRKALKEEMLPYGDGDVIALKELIHKLMPYIDLVKINHQTKNKCTEICPKCGHFPIQKRNTRPTQTRGLRVQYYCAGCMNYFTTGQNELTQQSAYLR